MISDDAIREALRLVCLTPDSAEVADVVAEKERWVHSWADDPATLDYIRRALNDCLHATIIQLLDWETQGRS